MDELAWVQYKQKQQKKAAREHILSVSHTKSQLAIGKGILSKVVCSTFITFACLVWTVWFSLPAMYHMVGTLTLYSPAKACRKVYDEVLQHECLGRCLSASQPGRLVPSISSRSQGWSNHGLLLYGVD